MGLIAFFLPYTYVYNLVYDKVRERWCAVVWSGG
ncbi:chlorhexidine efflux transporter [Stenotrophomonas rhizophila]